MSKTSLLSVIIILCLFAGGCVFAESGGGPELGGKGPLQISFEGRASSLALQQKRGGAWAEASALAEALNLLYLVNDSLNTIDLLIPAPRVAQSAHSDDKSKAKKKASVNKTDKAEPRRRQSSYFWTPSGIMPDILQSSPVSLESCDFYKDDGPYTPEPMLYMNSLVLKNNGGETLSVKVKICIRVDGAQVYEAEFGADSIPAGKSQKLNLEPSAWNNASGRPFMVQIKIASQ